LVPASGAQAVNERIALAGILFVLRINAAWRDVLAERIWAAE